MILIWGYIIDIITIFKNLAIYTLLLFTKDTRKHICGVKKKKRRSEICMQVRIYEAAIVEQ